MLKVTRHARQRAVSRLSMERSGVGKKLVWLHDSAKEVGPKRLPVWFRPKLFSPDTRFRMTNYAGREVVLVEASVADSLAILTVVTKEDE